MEENDTAQQEYETSRNLLMACTGLAAIFVAQTMLLLAVPLRALELGASPMMLGATLSLPHLLPLIFAIPLGGMVTRMGPQWVFLMGAVGMTLGPWLSWMLPGMTGLLIMQLMVGVAQLVIMIASQSIVASLGRGRALERYFGWYTTCISGGQLIGPLLAGVLIDRYNLDFVFIIIGAISIVAIVSSLLFVGSAQRGSAVGGELLGYRAQAGLLRVNAGVQTSILVTVSVSFALGAHASFLPVYLESLTFSATSIGVLLSLRPLAALVVRLGMHSIIDSLGGRFQAMVVSVGVVAVGIMWTGLTSDFMVLGFLAVLIGLGTGISQPLSMVTLAEHVSLGQRSSALGMRLMGNRGAQVIAPLMLGFLAELIGYRWAFALAGVGVLGAAVMTKRLFPALKRAELGSK